MRVIKGKDKRSGRRKRQEERELARQTDINILLRNKQHPEIGNIDILMTIMVTKQQNTESFIGTYTSCTLWKIK